MLTEWAIGNFKSIRKPIELKLAPLTILAGSNSSGKSTVIQSILMVAQSFFSTNNTDSLILNGQYVTLGSLDDIQHGGQNDEMIHIGFGIMPLDKNNLVIRVESLLKAQVITQASAKREKKYYPRLQRTIIEYARVSDNKERGVIEMGIHPEGKPDLNFLVLGTDLQNQVQSGIFDYRILNLDREKFIHNTYTERFERIGINGLVPYRLLMSIDTELQQLNEDIQWLIRELPRFHTDPRSSRNVSINQQTSRSLFNRKLSPKICYVFRNIRPSQGVYESLIKFVENHADNLHSHDLFTFLTEEAYDVTKIRDLQRRLSSALFDSLRKLSTSQERSVKYETRLLPQEYLEVFDQITQVMTKQIYYLGPIRAEPNVIFSIPPLTARSEVGLKGEYTAAVLDKYRNMIVEFPFPPGQDFSGDFQIKRDTLINALTIWLRRMELVDNVDTDETPKVGYRLIVTNEGLRKPLDLTNVGVGVSQVLPTLVLALISEKDSILIFEQPELHLHPKVQSILGDFFLGMSILGKQCIVETHSEYLINRLRRRIVEAPGNKILKNIRIHFVEKKQTESIFREVMPNEYGAIMEWPRGFFDESEEEVSIILERQMKKRQEEKLLKYSKKELK